MELLGCAGAAVVDGEGFSSFAIALICAKLIRMTVRCAMMDLCVNPRLGNNLNILSQLFVWDVYGLGIHNRLAELI